MGGEKHNSPILATCIGDRSSNQCIGASATIYLRKLMISRKPSSVLMLQERGSSGENNMGKVTVDVCDRIVVECMLWNVEFAKPQLHNSAGITDGVVATQEHSHCVCLSCQTSREEGGNKHSQMNFCPTCLTALMSSRAWRIVKLLPGWSLCTMNGLPLEHFYAHCHLNPSLESSLKSPLDGCCYQCVIIRPTWANRLLHVHLEHLMFMQGC
eukprot:2845813-Amphidinium_carterae.1